MKDLISLLVSFGLSESEAEYHGSPSEGSFWVEEYDTTKSESGEEPTFVVTVGNKGDGYSFFFTVFNFDKNGNYLSHGAFE